MDNRMVLLVVVLLAAVANAAAYVFDLYDRLFWVDKALHFYTSFAITLVLAFLWRAQLVQPLRAHPLVLMLALASLGVALGVAWEVGEWLADVFSTRNVIKGKTDTIVDLILDGAGAAAAGWLVLSRGRNSPETA